MYRLSTVYSTKRLFPLQTTSVLSCYVNAIITKWTEGPRPRPFSTIERKIELCDKWTALCTRNNTSHLPSRHQIGICNGKIRVSEAKSDKPESDCISLVFRSEGGKSSALCRAVQKEQNPSTGMFIIGRKSRCQVHFARCILPALQGGRNFSLKFCKKRTCRTLGMLLSDF